MATIIWTDPQGVEHRSHTLDPAGTKKEIEEQHGGTVVDVERPAEASTRKTYHRDSSGRVTHVTEESTLIKEEDLPKPVVEPEPELERERLPSAPIVGIGSIFESEAFKEQESRKRAEFVPGVPTITPPVSEPTVFERPGITAKPSQIKRLPPPRPPTEEQVQTVSVSRAEREAEVRIEGERISFEERERPIAQDVTQQKYNELIGRKATELGMTFDIGRGAWVGSESQLERFREYEPEARVQAMTFGTDYYQRQWEEFGIGERAEEITREEFGEEGFKLVEKDDGTFTVVSEAEFKKQQRFKAEKERIRERITGTPEERISEFTRFVSGSFIKPFAETGILAITGQALFGEPETKGEVILGKLARQSVEFDVSAPELFVKSFIDPEGLGFIATLAAVTTGVGGLLGKVGGPGGRILQRGIPVVVRGAFVTAIGAEIGITAAKEKPFDPTRGLEQIPSALFTGKTGELALRRFGQIAAFEYFASLAAGRPILPKVQREIVFEAKTGVLTEQRFFDVFGRQLKIPGIRQAQILRPTAPDSFRVLGIPSAKPFGTGPSFKTIVPTAPVKEPFIGGLSAKPSAAPFTISKFGDVTFVDTGITKPIVTGIPKPGVYTGRQPVLRGIRSLVEPPKPGKLIIAEPELKFAAITEGMEKNLKFIAKGKEWQPLTGIKEPTIRDITGRVKPYIPTEKTIMDRKPFRVKPKPDVVTRVDVTDKGIVSIEKYGRKLIDTGKIKGIVGLQLPGVYTGRQPVLRGPRPLVEVKRKPGRLISIEETLPTVTILESGLAKRFEGLIKIKPIVSKKVKEFRLKDIIKKEDTTFKTISGDRQQTIQVLEKPKVIAKQELKLKSLTKTKMKDVVVSKFKAKSILVTEKQYLEAMTQMKQVTPIQKQELRLGLLFAQDVRSKQMQKSETSMLLDMRKTGDTIQRKVLRFGLLPSQTTAQIKDTSFKFRTILTTAFVTPGFEPSITRPPVVKPTIKPFEEKIIEPIKLKTLGFEDDLMKGVSLAPQSYDVYTYKTQFKDGKRIRGKELEKINKKPLRRLDALALGSNVVDNNAKRTIILKEAEGKPTKLRKKVPSWMSQMFEYNDKGNNKFVEKNAHAIDSPGELREITMKGLSARRRGGKRGDSGLPRSISSFESRISRRLIL